MDGCMTQDECLRSRQAIELKLRLGDGSPQSSCRTEAGAHACIKAAAVHYGAEPTTATQELTFML